VTPAPVVLTAATGSFPGLADRIRGLPAAVEEIPLLTFAPPVDWAPVDQAVRELGRYEAVAFTSPRAAAAFAARLGESEAAVLPPVWVAGRGTAAALTSTGPAVRTAPEEETGRLGAAAALAAAMLDAGIAGPVLFPCGEIRRDELPTRLRQEGIEVHEVVCYRSVVADDEAARTALRRAAILMVASPSVAELVARVSAATPRPLLLAVGPTTAAAARAAGWPPAAVAQRPDIEALLETVRSMLPAVGAVP
jgi:uroporphyrinogen-III synthase